MSVLMFVFRNSQHSLPWALCDDDCWGNATGAWVTWCFNFTGQPVTVIQIIKSEWHTPSNKSNFNDSNTCYLSTYREWMHSWHFFQLGSEPKFSTCTFPPLLAWVHCGTTAWRPRQCWKHSFCRKTAGAGFELKPQIPVNKQSYHHNVSQ